MCGSRFVPILSWFLNYRENALAVQAMYESPAASRGLFSRYQVDYMLVGGLWKGFFSGQPELGKSIPAFTTTHPALSSDKKGDMTWLNYGPQNKRGCWRVTAFNFQGAGGRIFSSTAVCVPVWRKPVEQTPIYGGH